MKFLYLTDVHFGASPISRKPGYNEQILEKLRFVLKLAKKNGCVVLCGGDFFDKPKVGFLPLLQVIRLFKEYNVDFYCIRGNESHDSFAENSALSIMELAGIFKETGEYKDFGNVRVIFKDHGVDDVEKYVSLAHVNIMLTHQTIVKEPTIFEHTLIDDFKTNAQIVCVAHYHPYQGVMKNTKGTTFVAPGALARKKKVSHDIDRVIKCVYITVNDKKEFLIKEIDVPSVKDVWTDKSVLDISDDSCYNDLSAEVKNMKNLLMQEMNFSSIDEMLKSYAIVSGVEDSVLKFALGELEKI